MKKLVLSALSFMFLTLASNAAGIGYLDYDKVSNNYPLATKYNKELNSKVSAIKSYTQKRQDLVTKAKTTEEKAKLKKESLAQIDKMEKEYLTLRDKYVVELKSKILAAAQKVRTEKKLDIILNVDSTVVGGIDVTDDVIKALK